MPVYRRSHHNLAEHQQDLGYHAGYKCNSPQQFADRAVKLLAAATVLWVTRFEKTSKTYMVWFVMPMQKLGSSLGDPPKTNLYIILECMGRGGGPYTGSQLDVWGVHQGVRPCQTLLAS